MKPAKDIIISEPDQTHASVSHLLSRGYSLPCSTAAQAFTQLVQPTARFQLALDALLPLLDSQSRGVELAQRILVSFILYSLYAPYPITINPFRTVLHVAYVKERDKAIEVTHEGGVSANEQLVWVLWKILKGDGNDIGPYSPSTLARSPLPPKLRAVNLALDDELYNNTADLYDVTYSYFQKQQNNYRPSSASASLNNTNIPPSTNVISRLSPITRSPITVEDDRRNERVVQGMRLLLVARERTLTLAEQRVLLPLINDVTASRIITSLDLTPIVARNLSIAHPLFVGLLNNASDDNSNISQFLDVLPFLPPSLASMDLIGRLLRDQAFIKVPGYSTVADLVRMEVLGRFIHECIQWLERAEREEREGLISDDRFGKGVQNLCRFFNSLIKLQIVDPSSDVDSAEMMGFTLRCSRFEEANVLYRLFALSRY
ncbi:hypothetical protein AGABI1DRAFT_44725 [Agaricus bisporus var. burnettii JB137-S8]|uniref:Uncharacterized protein n=1 Tax=Agaricus bisporus var. burnettii (strain JB137-S8 / ATCC MYA-4627 / FGSC 10392) TaxID=597362 RepID=K5XPL6_AGABU|nr:uncharacterized protein AGABI1DRAFT_44725 [Agaricus bisporus var. burnettii JB137-S8]EKM76655.1 hypothetical protein AGABI1DRAFT_44725 [Agaricus bisporus var. burnettii JB137-S8]